MPGKTIDETLRKRFETAWAEGRPVPIEQCLPSQGDSQYLATLEELAHIEIEFAWKSRSEVGPADETQPMSQTVKGPPRVEAYLERFPQLGRPEVVVRLLQREYLVRTECGDTPSGQEYRQRLSDLEVDSKEIEALLETESRQGTESFHGAAQARGLISGGASRLRLPRRFGNYELLEQIGRGGMGIVYRARQLTADRIVALKVIRDDRLESLPRDANSSALDRFRHEAQAAARLEHENIVTVYEVGEVDGEPFFSMQYVAGQSLTEIVRDVPIPNRRAAVYVEPVARAVDHAHRQGILHRDLKPQNILVDATTDRPLVADFGLAKLLESGEDLTQSGEIMGSPPYMSPEQAVDSSQVTAQTDVYALGATLYHILTGRPPFQAATSLETLRQVTDREPVPPRQLNPSIDRDLETVCLKCLQKEPSRRYDTAGDLADDLRRYLDGVPIQARAISLAGRTVRWCRRNPSVAALLTSTAVFLILALVATLVGYVRTATALKSAEAGYSHARVAVDDFFTRVSEDTLLNQPGMQPLRRELLEQAMDYYRQFLQERGDDAAIPDELAMTYFRIGRITEQIDSPDEALPSFQRALEMQKRLVAEHAADREHLKALGNTYSAVGGVLFKQHKLDEAQQAHQEAVAIRGRLAGADPRQPELQRTLANSLMNLGLVERGRGDFDEARDHFEEAQAIRRRLLEDTPGSETVRRDLGMGCYNLGNLCLSLKPRDLEGAQANFEEAADSFRELLGEEPDDLANQHRLAVCCRLLGDLECVTGDSEAGATLYQEALERMQSLAGSNPDIPEYQAGLARLLMNLGQLESDQGRSEPALEFFGRALEMLEPLAARYAEVAHYRRDLAVTLRAMAALEIDTGQEKAARAHVLGAREHFGMLVEQFPDDPQYAELLQETADWLESLTSQARKNAD
ncbi:MAG: serine/threonine protein kinase [Planctomycetes bacterium]|nr:serine/threonine protein kinase [Planctomycetota bacterium]